MIERAVFGRSGHQSTRVVFGAAALAAMKPARAEAVLQLLLERGINHIDVAARYGEAEVNLRPWLAQHRGAFFVASKTGERDRQGAHREIRQSLERMQIDQLDLIQFHNLVDEDGHAQVFAAGGALEAALQARDEGLVRFIGVTGHGTRAAEMHLRSLDRFDFDSVLFPYNYSMLQEPEYAAQVASLRERCRKQGVAMQTIKSLARRRWPEGSQGPRFSWYEPIRDPQALAASVGWVLKEPDLFLNTSSDARLLAATLDAASEGQTPGDAELSAHQQAQGVEPLFVRGVAEGL